MRHNLSHGVGGVFDQLNILFDGVLFSHSNIYYDTVSLSTVIYKYGLMIVHKSICTQTRCDV